MNAFRKLLLPFAIVYGIVTFLRNKCYDWGIFKTTVIPKKSICVGNLSTGGTGKTPHVAFIASYLSNSLETTILSRGYGRKTNGFICVDSQQSVEQVGDEPLFYANTLNKNIHVAVCEKRAVGVQKIQDIYPSNELIILDDAFQHRAVTAGFSILLTEFDKPFSKDYMLPAGNLREWKMGRNRSDIVIVTKCPNKMDDVTKHQLAKDIKVEREKLFFSKISYGQMQSFGQLRTAPKNILLITGIANPIPLLQHLTKDYQVDHINFSDHHDFTLDEINEIHQKFDTFASDETIILTTEKDYMRLKNVVSVWNLEKYPWYFQPITVEIENEKEFKNLINQYVNTI